MESKDRGDLLNFRKVNIFTMSEKKLQGNFLLYLTNQELNIFENTIMKKIYLEYYFIKIIILCEYNFFKENF